MKFVPSQFVPFAAFITSFSLVWAVFLVPIVSAEGKQAQSAQTAGTALAQYPHSAQNTPDSTPQTADNPQHHSSHSSHNLLAQVSLDEFPDTLDLIEPEPTPPDATASATLEAQLATDSARTATLSAEQQEEIEQIRKDDITQPEEPVQRDEIFELLDQRPIDNPTLFNFLGFAVQYAIEAGLPANTVILVLLLPLLATVVAFVRHVVGLPSIGLFVPIALSITFVATGITAGTILLLSILFGATFAKMFLKRIKMMQLPKVALSMFVVAWFIFLTLTFSAKAGILVVRQLSIFPVLLLILLSERVVELQVERSARETITLTSVTVLLGILGFYILTFEPFRNIVLLYPEITLLLIPANILIGRYFGLRLTEYYRFSPIRNAGK